MVIDHAYITGFLAMKISLEIEILIFVPSVRNAKSLGSRGGIGYEWI